MRAMRDPGVKSARPGFVLDRDQGAVRNILRRGQDKVGRGTPEPNA